MHVYSFFFYKMITQLKLISRGKSGEMTNSPLTIGSQSIMELLMNTIPFLETVAGDALFNIVYFKDNFAIGSHYNTITVSQGQGFVVVKNGIQVLNPYGIHRSIQYKPNVLTLINKYNMIFQAHYTNVMYTKYFLILEYYLPF